MNHIKVKHQAVSIFFEDAIDSGEHDKIISKVMEMLSMGISEFTFDFSNVRGSISSSLVGFVFALVKNIKEANGTVLLDNLDGAGVDVLLTANIKQVCPEIGIRSLDGFYSC